MSGLMEGLDDGDDLSIIIHSLLSAAVAVLTPTATARYSSHPSHSFVAKGLLLIHSQQDTRLY